MYRLHSVHLAAPRAAQSRVIVTMEHCDRKGNSKVLSSCTLPITGIRCVGMLVTDKAVFEIDTKVRVGHVCPWTRAHVCLQSRRCPCLRAPMPHAVAVRARRAACRRAQWCSKSTRRAKPSTRSASECDVTTPASRLWRPRAAAVPVVGHLPRAARKC